MCRQTITNYFFCACKTLLTHRCKTAKRRDQDCTLPRHTHTPITTSNTQLRCYFCLEAVEEEKWDRENLMAFWERRSKWVYKDVDRKREGREFMGPERCSSGTEEEDSTETEVGEEEEEERAKDEEERVEEEKWERMREVVECEIEERLGLLDRRPKQG